MLGRQLDEEMTKKHNKGYKPNNSCYYFAIWKAIAKMAAGPDPSSGERIHSVLETVGEPVTEQQLSSLLGYHRTGMKEYMLVLLQISSQSLHLIIRSFCVCF